MSNNETKIPTCWLDWTTSLFKCNADNKGRPRTFRQIHLSDFAIDHETYHNINPRYKKNSKNPAERYYKITGHTNDIQNIVRVRRNEIHKDIIKKTLQCYTPSGYYASKKKGSEILINRLPLLQLDFDNPEGYDLDELKACIFALLFVAFVGLSVSGKALYCFILIAEPERLREYADHLFEVFKSYSITVDTSKGRNATDLRYCSYDANLLIREHPVPLKIEKFYEKPKTKFVTKLASTSNSNNAIIRWAVREIQNARRGINGQSGNRNPTVGRVAKTLGGHGFGLDEIKDAIRNSPQYHGDEDEFLNDAENAFARGQLKPIEV